MIYIRSFLNRACSRIATIIQGSENSEINLKIAYLITRSDTIGGAHVHVLDLALAAQAEGHDVRVLVGGEGPYTKLLREKGLQVVSLRFLVRPIRPHVDILAVLECWLILRRLQPDVVHAHSTKAGLVGRVAAKFAGIPIVFTAHGWAFTEGIAERSRRFARFLERWAAHLSAAIICVSEYDRRLALTLGVGDESLLTRIHNGVPDVSSDLRSRGGYDDVLRLVSVARLDAPKDHLLLLDALDMHRELPWKLELIGDGPLTETVKKRVSALRFEERVVFSGLCNDVAQRLAGADLFVLVSGWEGLPLSILEAMRAQLPVVASDVGGVAESVIDGQTGFLVNKGDKAVLAERLGRLLREGALRRSMGREGRMMYEREFSFDVMYRRTLDVYRRALAFKAQL